MANNSSRRKQSQQKLSWQQRQHEQLEQLEQRQQKSMQLSTIRIYPLPPLRLRAKAAHWLSRPLAFGSVALRLLRLRMWLKLRLLLLLVLLMLRAALGPQLSSTAKLASETLLGMRLPLLLLLPQG